MRLARMQNLAVMCIVLLCSTIAGAHASHAGPPAIHARAALLMSAGSGRVLYALHPDTPLPPASTTKIATALLVAQQPLSKSYPVSALAAGMPGNHLGIAAGQHYSGRSLLYAMLLVSANDAAEAAAEGIAGSDAAFAARMNALAQQAGATHTHFVNPNGLPAAGHVSTARDLALLARLALKNPAFAAAARCIAFHIPASSSHPGKNLVNSNTLLAVFPGMVGVKTGYTAAAGYCFVGAAHKGKRLLIVVLLHSPNWQKEAAELLRFGFAQAGRIALKQGALPSASVIGYKNMTGNGPAGTKDGGEPADSGAGSGQDAASAGINVWKESEGARTLNNARNALAAPAKKLYGRVQHSLSRTHFALKVSAVSTHLLKRFLLWGGILLLLLLLLWLAALLWRRRRKQKPARRRKTMRFGIARKQPVPAPVQAEAAGAAGRASVHFEKPEFLYHSPAPSRCTAPDWLSRIVETPALLMEPAMRRHVRVLLDTHPKTTSQALLPLLKHPGARTRALAAGMLLPSHPRRAEETLLSLLKEEQVSLELRTEAVEQLAAHGHDRHERLWVEMLLRDGFIPAARALGRMDALDDASAAAIKRVLEEAKQPADADAKLRQNLRDATAMLVLALHQPEWEEKAKQKLRELPPKHRDNVVVQMLEGQPQDFALDRMLECALTGHAFPAMQALLHLPPGQVTAALDEKAEGMDTAEKTRASIIRWLLTGEGDAKRIHALADAGNDMATAALNQASLCRWNATELPAGALTAAAQIVSLRLGYTSHTNEEITSALRRSLKSDAGPGREIPDELQPLSSAYENEQVYHAVQAAMQSDEGMNELLSALSVAEASPMKRAETAFWADKAPAPVRYLLMQHLCTEQDELSHEALAGRTMDSDASVREFALRRLRTAATAPSEAEAAVQQESPIDQAA